MTLEQALFAARKALTRRRIVDAPLEAEVLLRHTLNLTRAQLYTSFDLEIGLEDVGHYLSLVDRRLAGEPTAYIIGRREFYGLDFHVDRRVLIPRPESELLVEKAVQLAREGASSFADIGTGSGAIAISLAVSIPWAKVYATDISGDALAVALTNCREHRVDDRIELLAGDLLEPLSEAVDVIVANLPYVREHEMSRVNTAGYEPPLALNGGLDGLDKLRRLCAQLEGRLKRGGTLLLEIGRGQKRTVRSFLQCYFPSARVDFTSDFAGIPRVVGLTLP